MGIFFYGRRTAVARTVEKGDFESLVASLNSAMSDEHKRNARIALASYGLGNVVNNPVRAAAAMALALEGFGLINEDGVRFVATKEVVVVYPPNQMPVVAFLDGVMVQGQRIMQDCGLIEKASELTPGDVNAARTDMSAIDYIASQRTFIFDHQKKYAPQL